MLIRKIIDSRRSADICSSIVHCCQGLGRGFVRGSENNVVSGSRSRVESLGTKSRESGDLEQL